MLLITLAAASLALPAVAELPDEKPFFVERGPYDEPYLVKYSLVVE